MSANSRLNLRVGEVVEVRSEAEILSTLDANGRLEGLPFMPEMLKYCGQRFQVYKSAHKTCDTIQPVGMRRLKDAVHLEGLRCDGEFHGGCQYGCLLFWKEAWLKHSSARESRESLSTLRGGQGSSILESARYCWSAPCLVSRALHLETGSMARTRFPPFHSHVQRRRLAGRLERQIPRHQACLAPGPSNLDVCDSDHLSP